MGEGWNHTCAIVDGAVRCWGWNEYGQLGDGTTENRTTPVEVVGLGPGVRAVSAAGSRTCALTAESKVACWGAGEAVTPVEVAGLGAGVQAVTTGGGHSCALSGGGVQCWGGNEFGQLGDGTASDQTLPVAVVGLDSGVLSVALGAAHTCALSAGGAVSCWGRNESGQLGDGTTTDRSGPVAVVGLASAVQAVASWEDHTCALTTDGAVMCWGNNESGQLGDGTNTNRSTPVAVVGLDAGVRAIAAGAAHTCALKDATLMCWGGNKFGQVGDGTTTGRKKPVAVVGLGGPVQAVALGGYHTCALNADQTVACWGHNKFGQLGDGTTRQRATPVPVGGLP